ncbi:MAG: hypothetical protein ACRET4_16970, partial [Steroidobacteraceae bacterium]
MSRTFALLGAATCGLCMLLVEPALADAVPATRNVVLIVSDGLRWQEVFSGADPALMNVEHGGIWAKPEDFKRDYWRDDGSARRRVLMPFLWESIGTHGQIFGNQTRRSVARVTNAMHFS